MNVSFGECHRFAEHTTRAGLVNLKGDEHRTVDDLSAAAYLLVARVEHHIQRGAKGSVAPRHEHVIEDGHAAINLGETDIDLRSYEVPQYPDDFATRDAFTMHFGKG